MQFLHKFYVWNSLGKIKIITRIYPSYDKSQILLIHSTSCGDKEVCSGCCKWVTHQTDRVMHHARFILTRHICGHWPDHKPKTTVRKGTVVAGDDKNFAASVATSGCAALFSQSHAPICSGQLQAGHQSQRFLFRRRRNRTGERRSIGARHWYWRIWFNCV